MQTEDLVIERMLIEPLNIELAEPFGIAIGTKYSIENVLVTLVLKNGISGYGEAAPLEPINGENQSTVLSTLDSCRDFIVGKSVSDYISISRTLKSVFRAQNTARCAVEMALLDAYTKFLKIPLYRFFGGVTRKIETDYTITIVTPDEARENATALNAKGYRILKTKVGKDLKGDVERLSAIMDGAPGCSVTVDANQGYTPTDAVRFIQELEKRNIRPLLFEQPVLKDDLYGMKYVKEHISVPVAADESVFSGTDAINVVRSGCADVINIKLMKSGIIEALDIAAIARNANIKLMIGCMLETKLGLGCSVHFAAGLGVFNYIDLDPHIDPALEAFDEGPDFAAPWYSLSDDRCGIGVRKK
ncbi:MAG TPA: dipeptide epimerase [Bacteroidales bacterium]|nr:dipeptide epimerase [Bacteroidales bacterium]HNR41336.1 dipeptide epimerase [Bacteroidales bacterium]HPM18230.1 dipeptide epimerase [Bacteroidales bacterium]